MRQRGFTLLEMIVVLAILGLATALVAPSAIRGIDSWRRQSELDSLLDQIRALPGNARATGKAIAISDDALKAKDAPLRVASSWYSATISSRSTTGSVSGRSSRWSSLTRRRP